jgi:hypothetical protein
VYDINAREAEEIQGLLDACPGIQQVRDMNTCMLFIFAYSYK